MHQYLDQAAKFPEEHQCLATVAIVGAQVLRYDRNV